jgi:hypothetical protein
VGREGQVTRVQAGVTSTRQARGVEGMPVRAGSPAFRRGPQDLLPASAALETEPQNLLPAASQPRRSRRRSRRSQPPALGGPAPLSAAARAGPEGGEVGEGPQVAAGIPRPRPGLGLSGRLRPHGRPGAPLALPGGLESLQRPCGRRGFTSIFSPMQVAIFPGLGRGCPGSALRAVPSR